MPPDRIAAAVGTVEQNAKPRGYTLDVELGEGRRAISMVPVDMTDEELLRWCATLMTQGRANLIAAREKATGIFVPRPGLFVRD